MQTFVHKVDPCAIDRSVGVRIRVLRLSRGVSRQVLARTAGVTCVELADIEHGSRCIGASELYLISTLLAAPVGFFFDEPQPDAADEAEGPEEANALLEAYSGVAHPEARAAVVRLIAAVGAG